MEIKKALGTISILANGADPYTGEVYPADSPYQQPETIRALFVAKELLSKEALKEERASRLPVNAGKPWTPEEDNALLTKFDQGTAIQELAKIHERTLNAINARLVMHGKIAAAV